MKEILGLFVMFIGALVYFFGHMVGDYIDFCKTMEDDDMEDLYEIITENGTVIDHDLTYEDALAYLEHPNYKDVYIQPQED